MPNKDKTPNRLEKIIEDLEALEAQPEEPLILNLSGILTAPNEFPRKDDRHSVREWWQGILANYGRYSCYAIFLALPSDKEFIRYITDFGRELDLVSGDNCLIIALSKTDFRRSGVDDKIQKGKRKAYNFIQHIWNSIVKEHITLGYSVQVAEFFDIGFEKFPCLVIFQDIRKPNHALIAIKDMTAEEIAEKMRVTFSIIQEAISTNKNPLDALQSQRTKEALQRKGNSIVSELRSIAGKTFEMAIDAWIKASLK